MDDLRMEPAFTDLYDDAKDALAQGYIRADQLVYNFAMDYDISPEDAWRLITQEASQRGEEVIQYLSENPLDERSYKTKNAQRQAGWFAAKGLDYASEWFRGRGGRCR
jgi:ABC-type nitrate/sulfonate/bicarbonate transport system substrate-binding protein